MMPRRATFALIVVLLPASVPAQSPGQFHAQSDAALWRFVPPDAKALIGIDWARVRQSQAGALIREKWIPHSTLPAFRWLELLDSVDRFLISSPARNTPEDGAGDAEDSGDSPILIAIQGRFDAAHVRELFERAGAKRQSYDSFQVYRPQSPQGRNSAFVLFDAGTILYGDAPSVFAALDRNRFPAPPEPPSAGSITARAAALQAKYELWAVLDGGEVLANDRIADLFGATAWADAAQGFEAGLNLHSGLDADFMMHFSSDEAAKRVTADFTRAVAQMSRDRSVDQQAQNLARKLKFTVDGPAARVSLHLNEQELEKTARALFGAEKSGERLAANSGSSATPAPATAPAPSKPAMIRIEGLDDGPREIPFQPPQ